MSIYELLNQIIPQSAFLVGSTYLKVIGVRLK